VVPRLGFRVARNPEAVELAFDQVFVVLSAGERRSKRLKGVANYDEGTSQDEFPSLGYVPVALPKDMRVRVVELTAGNDPLLGREPMVESESMSMDEVESFLHGDDEDSVILGHPGNSVGEWAMSMSFVKDEAGRSQMRDMQALASSSEEKCDEVALGAFNGFQLHRRIPHGSGMDWALAVGYDGWSGWLVLECLSRRHSAPGSAPLLLNSAIDRGRLATFLEGIRGSVECVAVSKKFEICVMRLVGQPFSDLEEVDGLRLTPDLLGLLNLSMLVCVWEVSE
jgi:hypothetical protein